MAGEIKVVLGDSHELFRRGLAALLREQPGIEVVGEAAGLSGVLSAARAHQARVVVIECHLGDGDGTDLCEALVALAHAPRVIVLTASESEADMYAVLRAGASGYLLKDSTVAEVVQGIQVVAEGQTLISPAMALKLVDEFKARDEAAGKAPTDLTDREREVLRWVSTGMGNQQVADELSISVNTVKNHLASILGKLGLSTRTEAAMYAVRERLVEIPRRTAR